MNPGLLNDEERFLSAHIADLQKAAERTGAPRFSAFLNEREAMVARCAVKGEPVFFGGYSGAMRTVCGFVEGIPSSSALGLIPYVWSAAQGM